jgi:HK97 family phage major capsid protein
MLKYLRKQLSTLLDERAELKSDVDGIVAAAETEARDLTESEAAAFSEARSKVIEKDTAIEELRGRIKTLEEDEAREGKVREVQASLSDLPGEERAHAPARVTSEPETYRKGGQVSYFRDIVAVGLNKANRSTYDRLERNNREVADSTEFRALTATDGAGGDFVPPLWMVNQAVMLARAARPTADRVTNMTLPTGTDSLNVPKLLTGTAVATQATQNTAVQNTDATTTSVTAAVTTIAGQQVVSVQLIEQSPFNMDELLLNDLAADYAAKVDLFVLNNNATGAKGLLQEAGTNAITYTSGAPTVALLYSQIANASQTVGTNRFLPADTIVMHPRRWAYFLAASDSSGRPLVTPAAQGPYNQTAQSVAPQQGQGVAGNIQGLDVILDPQIPTNLGGGTNQDAIIVFRAADSVLWEGTPRSEAFRETYANQLSVLLRFYNYAAFTTARYQKSVSVINGTGLVAPTF